MASKAMLILLVASAITLTVGRSPGSQYPLQLTHVGFIDGRAFFTDLEARMNWANATNACVAAGHQPAQISTDYQHAYLITNLPVSNFGFWTGGKFPVNDFLNRLGWNDGEGETETRIECLSIQKSVGLTLRSCTNIFHPLCHV